jgi:hypothetical protein
MRVLRHFQWPALAGVLLGLLVTNLRAQSTLVYVSDANGNIGQFDVRLGSGTVLGSLSASGFTAGQVIGLAYDSMTNGVLIFDRSANTVYTMNASTGVATVLFTTPGVTFQGGAIFGGLIYGINENTQQLNAFSFSGVAQSLSGTNLTAHVHALGLNPVTEQLVYLSSSSGLRVINTDGTEGDVLLNSTQTGSIYGEDVAYYNGGYLVASYDSQLYLLDGITGTSSVFITSAQITAMGMVGSVSGVDLNFIAVPEPGTWILLLMGLGAVVMFTIRRRPIK